MRGFQKQGFREQVYFKNSTDQHNFEFWNPCLFENMYFESTTSFTIYGCWEPELGTIQYNHIFYRLWTMYCTFSTTSYTDFVVFFTWELSKMYSKLWKIVRRPPARLGKGRQLKLGLVRLGYVTSGQVRLG